MKNKQKQLNDLKQLIFFIHIHSDGPLKRGSIYLITTWLIVSDFRNFWIVLIKKKFK